MGGKSSRVVEEKKPTDKKTDDQGDGYTFKKIILCGTRCSGKFSLYSTVRWIYRYKAFETRVSWIRHRNQTVLQLLRDTIQMIDINQDFITNNGDHSARQTGLSQQINTIREFLNEKTEESDTMSSFSKETLTSVINALKDIWSDWNDINQVWHQHWQHYFVNPHSIWFLSRLNETDVFEYLTSENPMDKGSFEKYIRGYQFGRPSNRWDVFVDKTFVEERATLISMVLSHMMRTQYDDSEIVGRMDKHIGKCISDFHGGFNDNVKRMVRENRGFVYEWCYFPSGFPLRGEWQEDVPDADFFFHVSSLVGFATKLKLRDETTMDRDLQLFTQMVNGQVFDTQQQSKSPRTTVAADLKPTARCILVFSNLDTLRDLIKNDTLKDDSLPDYKGPRFSDEHKDCSDDEWLDRCSEGLTNYVISKYIAVPGFEDFVMKVIILNPTNVSEVAEKLLTKQVFRMIDECGGDMDEEYSILKK